MYKNTVRFEPESTVSQVEKARWDQFAKNDAYSYILTAVPADDREGFWRSGEDTVRNELLPLIQRFGITGGTALEIGCGVGRLVFPVSAYFSKVVGLDISPEMVRQATALAAQKNTTNVAFIHSAKNQQQVLNDIGLSEGELDFVYSVIVFQHIPDFNTILDYFRLVAFLLSSRGVAYLHFDTRPKNFMYRIKSSLPDAVLPRFFRRGIRRVRREIGQLEDGFKACGLKVIDRIEPYTDETRYILGKI